MIDQTPQHTDSPDLPCARAAIADFFDAEVDRREADLDRARTQVAEAQRRRQEVRDGDRLTDSEVMAVHQRVQDAGADIGRALEAGACAFTPDDMEAVFAKAATVKRGLIADGYQF
ncbi:hypothetical protein GXW83_17495 [Streptacidiphilus sp. PB12-B1b]|uniref:hypothetical protein n=1 Tax=Streptacidiphilus sp. PB12-B1b TaxID=2705012 RepID=UPI0015F7CD49|nr:hypothetical protein [Streptacidiphilus sp. PB12-B1b]QMU77232.1 hypothetical protein GXW83_17495 [Streptacidiphilus sp. PB12-B1b]